MHTCIHRVHTYIYVAKCANARKQKILPNRLNNKFLFKVSDLLLREIKRNFGLLITHRENINET